MIKYFGTVLFCILIHFAWAQEDKKFNNGKVIGVPAQIQPKDSILPADSVKIGKDLQKKTEINQKDNKPENATSQANFNLYKNLSVVSEDTLLKKLGELKVVKISEELRIDCVWVKAAEYYAVWDSKNINPYNKDASLFKDTIDILLYSYPLGQLWAAPLDRTLQTSAFGYRWGRFHHGVDLDLKMGTPVYTTFDGIIRISAFTQGYGNYVVVRHRNGLETLYAHLSSRKVEIGQVVKAGQLIGLGGSTGWSTGPHLHFEVRYEGNSFNPLMLYDFSKEDVLVSDKFTLLPQHFSHLGNLVRARLIHKVIPGETLSIISAKYNIPLATLAKINQITINAVLRVGQSLIIR